MHSSTPNRTCTYLNHTHIQHTHPTHNEPAYEQNLESFASKVRGLLSTTLLRSLGVIAVIVTGLLWFTGRASTAVLVTVIIGIAIVFSADAIVGAIAG